MREKTADNMQNEADGMKILPCPFCGETEDIDYGINYGTLRGFDYVQCQSCGAEIHSKHTDGKAIAAIDLWNRREAGTNKKSGDKISLTFTSEVKDYFPEGTTNKQIKEMIIMLLEKHSGEFVK